MAKVLLADDSVTIQKVVEIILTSKGYELMSVSNGRDAIDALASFAPDIVLADIDMPKLGGYEVSGMIKGEPSTRKIKVILIAGAFEDIDEERLKNSGADATLTKPFEAEDLLAGIAKVLGIGAGDVRSAPRPVPGPVVEVEGLERSEIMDPLADTEPLEALPGTPEAIEAQPVETLDALGEPEAMELVEVTSYSTAELVEGETVEAEVVEAEVVEAEVVEAEVVEAEAVEAEQAVPTEEHPAFAEPPGVHDDTGVIGVETAPEPVGLEAISDEPHEGLAGDMAHSPNLEPQMPGAEELIAQFKEVAGGKMDEFVKGADMRAIMVDTIGPGLHDALEKVIWEIAPELVERLIKEAVADTMKSLTKELETVIWETVPELAENIIIKEIDRIKKES